MRSGKFILVMLVTLAVLAVGSAVAAGPSTTPAELSGLLPDMGSPKGVSSAMTWLVLLTALSLAPAILVLVTCFTRVIVVLGLLRQALATQQVPPNQILFGLALLLTILVMAPVYQDVHRDAIGPYLSGKLDQAAALDAGKGHIRRFMIRQVETARNEADVKLFLDAPLAAKADLTWADVPTAALVSGYVISELKVAFLMGLRIFLPFVIIDMLVATVLTSMGMLMLPPVLVSLPFKLLLFVLADGWHLVIGTLMKSLG